MTYAVFTAASVHIMSSISPQWALSRLPGLDARGIRLTEESGQDRLKSLLLGEGVQVFGGTDVEGIVGDRRGR